MQQSVLNAYRERRIAPKFNGEIFSHEWLIYQLLTLPKSWTWLQKWKAAKLYFGACVNHANLEGIIDKTSEFANADKKTQVAMLRKQAKRIDIANQPDEELWEEFQMMIP